MSDNGIDKSIEYMQNLFTSMEIIGKKQLERLAFDKTIVCTITDATKRDDGEYIVTDGTTTFRAYSDSAIKYMTGAKVFVTVPQGDFSQQKIISGRYTEETKNKPYSYVPVSESFIDITLNLNQNSEVVDAAAFKKEDDEWAKSGSTILYQANANNVVGGLSQYDALYIAAEFQTFLETYNQLNNHFGIKVSVLGKSDDSLDNYSAAEDSELDDYEVYKEETKGYLKEWVWKLDSGEMFGSPFSFYNFSKQEKLFDLKEIELIRFIKVELYWDFPEVADEDLEKNLILNGFKNIFLKNFYISFGTRFSEYTENSTLVPYCLEQKTYGNYIREAYVDKYDNIQDYNAKNIQLRWIWMDEDSGKFIAISNEDKMREVFGDRAKIVWYRNDLDGDSFSSKNTDATFMMPYIVTDGTPFKFKFIPNEKLPLEKLMVTAEVIDEQTGETVIYKSDYLTFTNEDEVLLNGAVDLVKGLTIECDVNGQGGSYFLYGEDGAIISYAEQSKIREFRANYTSIDGGTQMNDAESITWYIPKDRTMFVIDPKKHLAADDVLEEDGEYWKITKADIFFTKESKDAEKTYNKQTFSISGNYGANYSNNTVRCEVVKGGKTYTAEYTPAFGYSGSNGTDYRLNVTAEDDEIAFDLSNQESNSIGLLISVTDNAGAEVVDGVLECNWYEPKLANNRLLEASIDENNSKRIIINKPAGFNQMTTNYVLEVRFTMEVVKQDTEEVSAQSESGDDAEASESAPVVEETKTQTVTRYVPIIFYNSKVTADPFTTADYAGADKICYNLLGSNPTFISSPYVINIPNVSENELTWEVYYDSHSVNSDAVTVSMKNMLPGMQNNILVPRTIFMTGAETKVGVAAKYKSNVILYQPLLIIQNAYNSAMLNQWDGETVVDTANNRIMSATIAAGSKDEDNRFNGVVMGELKEVLGDKSTVSTSGILGLHEGALSFGLKNDGTMFIGKSGTGRIQFDGNKSIITSDGYLSEGGKKDPSGVLSTPTDSLYNENATGIYMDLDDAILHVGGPAISFLIDAKGSIETTREDGTEAFTIKTNGTEKLMSVKAKTEEVNGAQKTTITEFLIQSPLVGETDNSLVADFKNASFSAKNGAGKGNLVIDAADTEVPFNVNEKFLIKWDGSMEATAGKIGGWVINDSGLMSQLDPNATGAQDMIGLFHKNYQPFKDSKDFSTIRIFVGEILGKPVIPGLEADDIKIIDNSWKKPVYDDKGNIQTDASGKPLYENISSSTTFQPYKVSKAVFYVNSSGQLTAYQAKLYGAEISALVATDSFTCTGAAFFGKDVSIERGHTLYCSNISGWHPSFSAKGSASYSKYVPGEGVSVTVQNHYHNLNSSKTGTGYALTGGTVSVAKVGDYQNATASVTVYGTL